MFNAATVKLVFGGLSVDADLRWLSELAGKRFVLDHTRQSGPDWRTQYSSQWSEAPVLRPDEIRTLDEGHALVMFAATAPVIAELPLVFHTRDGKRVAAETRTMAARNDQARSAALT
jgi:type IV secretory pathway TraG/TraD family ATPase VirD4